GGLEFVNDRPRAEGVRRTGKAVKLHDVSKGWRGKLVSAQRSGRGDEATGVPGRCAAGYYDRGARSMISRTRFVSVAMSNGLAMISIPRPKNERPRAVSA